MSDKQTNKQKSLKKNNNFSDQSQPEQHKKLIEEIEQQFRQQSSHTFADTSRDGAADSSSSSPSFEYEQLRRRVRSNTQEMWNYVNSEVTAIRGLALPAGAGDSNAITQKIDAMLAMTAEHKRSLLNDMDRMRQVDGYEMWRRRESADLSDLVQKRLTYLQHPDNCERAQKLVCRLNKVLYLFAITQLISPPLNVGALS